MKKGIVFFGVFGICNMALADGDNVSQQIQLLNSQIQAQLQKVQADQQTQIQTLNKQIQAQLKQMQADLQAQIQKANTTTQDQLKQMQSQINAQSTTQPQTVAAPPATKTIPK